MTTTTQQTVLEQRVTALEDRLVFQEDTIETLNQAVIDAQMQLQKLREQLRVLAEKLAQQTSSPLASLQDETPPPHY